jgi:type IV fimbrial biogenesis protein FimT
MPHGGTMRTRRGQAGGYTLIEMAVVIVIIAIILAYAVPSYKGLIAENRMSGEVNDLLNDVEQSRSAAIKQGVPVVICPSTDSTAAVPSCSGSSSWTTGWIAFTDVAQNQTFAAASGDTLLRVHTGLQVGDTMVGAVGATDVGPFGGNLTYLSFNRMGAAAIAGPSNYAAISVHDAANTAAWRQCLVVSLVGMASIDANQNAVNCP